jgi:alpha-L-fucosidase
MYYLIQNFLIMKRIIVIALLLSILSIRLFAQTSSHIYKPEWADLDQRPTPQWWSDAKFGIFIHWGIYSVPSFSKVGEYAEWYWNSLKEGKPDYVNFHNKNYGPLFTYPDFVPQFKCELFNPDQWAGIFKESGAKYIVLTSKHHEGFTLWQSQEANRDWGRPWNAVDAGPGRDLLGDLTASVRKAGLKMGIYYSLYEWYNPLYKTNVPMYVKNHMTPQFKDVVTRYSPSVIFSDGEWDHADTTWKSQELLAWLFNESPCKNEVVVNDRWGGNTRHHHGGYFTTEYGSGMADAAHPWEESRGMAYSYGYSRTENAEDYNSAQKLIYMLIDIVSRGGNFLLDIGPAADGSIPVIMQDRLLGMGQWLKVNGEAIYGTKTWKNSCQWSKGEIKDAERGEFMIKYDIMKLTLHPDKGMAVKEIFFTRKSDTLYCITPVYPSGKLVIKDTQAGKKTRVSMLGLSQDLKWKQSGNNIEIEVPGLTPSNSPCENAWTFRITGIKK